MHMQASEQLTGGGAGQRYMSGSAGVTVSSQLASWRSRRGVGLDITALPDMRALSAKVSTGLANNSYVIAKQPLKCAATSEVRLCASKSTWLTDTRPEHGGQSFDEAMALYPDVSVGRLQWTQYYTQGRMHLCCRITIS